MDTDPNVLFHQERKRFRDALHEFRIGNGQNTVSTVLFRKRELNAFCSKLSEFCEKLGAFALAHNNRLRSTHWAPSPELGEDKTLTELGV